jgi:hypothetical protein
VSSDPQEIAPGLWVGTYAGPAGMDSATRRRWQLTTREGYLQLSYEQMCALRRWFIGPDIQSADPDPLLAPSVD